MLELLLENPCSEGLSWGREMSQMVKIVRLNCILSVVSLSSSRSTPRTRSRSWSWSISIKSSLVFNIQCQKLKRKDLERHYNQMIHPPTYPFSGKNELVKEIWKKKFSDQLFFGSISSDTLVQWSPGAQVAFLSFQWSKWAGGKNLRKTWRDTIIKWSADPPTHQTTFKSCNLSFQWSKWVGEGNLRKNLPQLQMVNMSWG